MLSWLRHEYGNLAGVAGLVLTLVTLWYVRRVRTAVQDAVRDTLARIRLQHLFDAVVEFHRLVREVREASRTRSWERAIDRCEMAISLLNRILGHPRLLPDEKRRAAAFA